MCINFIFSVITLFFLFQIDTSTAAKRKRRSSIWWKTSTTFCRSATDHFTTNFHSWLPTNSTATTATPTSWTTPHLATHSDTRLPTNSVAASACSKCSTSISNSIAICASAHWTCAVSILAGASASACLSCRSGTSASTNSQNLLLSC